MLDPDQATPWVLLSPGMLRVIVAQTSAGQAYGVRVEYSLPQIINPRHDTVDLP